MKVEILGVIPARGGSKGIERKNLRPLAGKPLISYAISAAQGSRLLSRLIVSTEDEEIAALVSGLGCEVLRRPDELARDDTPMVPVVQHVVEGLAEREGYRPEVTVILQPTAPLRRAEHIDAALSLLLNTNAGSVVSVSPVPAHFNPEWQFITTSEDELQTYSGQTLGDIQTRRQDLPVTYTRNGAVYAFRTDLFLQTGSLYVKPCKALRMAPEDSVNLDAEEDFWLAEQYLQRRRREKEGGSSAVRGE